MTPTSASAASRRPGSWGFTLLEILVVVALLALFASISLPLLNRDTSPRDFAWQARRLQDTVQRLSENSLFRGELLAMRLSADGYEPLRFDQDGRRFVAMDESEHLAAFVLPEGIGLEWELDRQGAADEPSLADAARTHLLDNDPARLPGAAADEVLPGAGDRRPEAAAEERGAPSEGRELPQLFFFPSGEATPTRFRLVNAENGEEIRLDMDAMARVTTQAGDDEEHDG